MPMQRSTLLKLLTEACELEHGLACSYMFAAMSLRQEPAAEIFPAEKLSLSRQWASQIYFIASQEMLHLAQAWNLLLALGGTPYALRPNFPQRSNYYPFNLPLQLESFGEAPLRRFIGFETPAQLLPEHSHFGREPPPEEHFHSIGELYAIVKQGFETLPNAFIGDPGDQIGPDILDFPDLVRVVDVASARRAIDMITDQGEGTGKDRADCHFGIFVKLLEALDREKASNPKFSPAYETIVDATTDKSAQYGAPDGMLIENGSTLEIAKTFDGLYSLMLRMLLYVFTPRGDRALKREFGQAAILIMVTALKPLGEALTQLPAGTTHSEPTAGPTFGLTRHVTFSADPTSARALAVERLAELTNDLSQQAILPGRPPSLSRIALALQRIQIPAHDGNFTKENSRRPAAGGFASA
jgi:hypothetical protein